MEDSKEGALELLDALPMWVALAASLSVLHCILILLNQSLNLWLAAYGRSLAGGGTLPGDEVPIERLADAELRHERTHGREPLAAACLLLVVLSIRMSVEGLSLQLSSSPLAAFAPFLRFITAMPAVQLSSGPRPNCGAISSSQEFLKLSLLRTAIGLLALTSLLYSPALHSVWSQLWSAFWTRRQDSAQELTERGPAHQPEYYSFLRVSLIAQLLSDSILLALIFAFGGDSVAMKSPLAAIVGIVGVMWLILSALSLAESSSGLPETLIVAAGSSNCGAVLGTVASSAPGRAGRQGAAGSCFAAEAWEGAYQLQLEKCNGQSMWELRTPYETFVLASSTQGIWCIERFTGGSYQDFQQLFIESGTSAILRFEVFHRGVPPHLLRKIFKVPWSMSVGGRRRFEQRADIVVCPYTDGVNLPRTVIDTCAWPYRLRVQTLDGDYYSRPIQQIRRSPHESELVHVNGTYTRHGIFNEKPFWKEDSSLGSKFIYATLSGRWAVSFKHGAFHETPDGVSNYPIIRSERSADEANLACTRRVPQEVLIWAKRIHRSMDQWESDKNIKIYALGSRFSVAGLFDDHGYNAYGDRGVDMPNMYKFGGRDRKSGRRQSAMDWFGVYAPGFGRSRGEYAERKSMFFSMFGHGSSSAGDRGGGLPHRPRKSIFDMFGNSVSSQRSPARGGRSSFLGFGRSRVSFSHKQPEFISPSPLGRSTFNRE